MRREIKLAYFVPSIPQIPNGHMNTLQSRVVLRRDQKQLTPKSSQDHSRLANEGRKQ